jgi:hypothetical protein
MGFEPVISMCQLNWKNKLRKEPIETTEPITQTAHDFYT